MESWLQKLTRGFRHGRYFFQPTSKRVPNDFFHIPTTIPRSLWTLAQNKAALHKIEEGFFENNLIVVIGIAKSATKSIVRSLRVLQDHYRPLNSIVPIWRPEMTKGRYFDIPGTADLQLEIAIDVLDGGVVHTHSTPNYRSLYVLDQLKSKYVLSFRHPLSRIAPIYCSCLQNFVTSPDPTSHPRFFLEPIFPVRSDIFDSNKNTDEVIEYMIEGGFLEATLLWMAIWLEIRDPDRSVIVKYEDLMSNHRATTERLSSFHFGAVPDASVLDACETSYNEDIREASFTYPRGWPGTSEAISEYFNKENRQRYEKVVGNFVGSSILGRRLLDVYPDLLDSNI